MTRKLFGTDGIRGRANVEPMTPETAMAVARAAGAEFTRGPHRHQVVIGKDTRLSGYLLEPAMTAGFIAVGMDVVLLGPLPTPAVGMLTRSLRADLGVMISASHNPFEDNGIKLFGPDGYKLSDEVEAYLVQRLAACRVAGLGNDQLCVDAGIGFAKTAEQSARLVAATRRLTGLGVAVLVGASRKSFIGRLSQGEPADQRLPGSLAAALAAVAHGAHILRVHDVAETAQALRVWQAVYPSPLPARQV